MIQILVEELDECIRCPKITREFLFEMEQIVSCLRIHDRNYSKLREADLIIQEIRRELNIVRETKKYDTLEESCINRRYDTFEESCINRTYDTVGELNKSLNLLLQCEKTSDDILLELSRNRQTILKSQDITRQVEKKELSKSNRFIQSMMSWWK